MKEARKRLTSLLALFRLEAEAADYRPIDRIGYLSDKILDPPVRPGLTDNSDQSNVHNLQLNHHIEFSWRIDEFEIAQHN